MLQIALDEQVSGTLERGMALDASVWRRHENEVTPGVIRQHVEEVADLYITRRKVTSAPHTQLEGLRRLDNRLAAHLDGLSVAGERAWPFCVAALEDSLNGAMFAAVVRSVQDRRQARFDRLVLIAESQPARSEALIAALGWLDRHHLRGIVEGLLSAEDSFRRIAGITACASHGIDPGQLFRRPQDPDADARARVLRAAGEMGRPEVLSACGSATADVQPGGQFWAAWSGVLLGDRNRALQAIVLTGTSAGPHRSRAFRLALQAATTSAAHRILQGVARNPKDLRWLTQGTGIAGDPTYVPWLLRHMARPETARLAGEAFTLITGADLERLQLDRPGPEGIEAGPNDDPDEPDVDMDPDDGLPWPDSEKVQAWWDSNAHRFAVGRRYFMGAPVTRAHCINVLKSGYQRQRVLAAHYLCLLDPGTPLFNTSAPAWRQQRLLASM
jgi:uncharacterized protein (TIGR02270 family)